MQKVILTLLFIFIITSCSPQSSDRQTRNERMSPGYAKISATVIDVYSILDSNQAKPCGQTPCYAKVRIESVHGYGSAFGSPLVAGSTIVLKFMFTLEPTTEENFPNLEKLFPGLIIGSKFTGDIEQTENSKIEVVDSEEKLYRIFDYQLID